MTMLARDPTQFTSNWTDVLAGMLSRRGHHKEMPRSSEDILADIRHRLGTVSEPPVRESIERHFDHLEQLAQSLRALRFDTESGDQAVLEVFEDYEQQLRQCMTILKP
jgi:hypothetical protein